MSLRKTTIGALFALSAFVASSAALAQAKPADAGFYIGGSYGEASVDDFCEGLSSCDEKDGAWKVFGGWQFNRNFALELGYTDLGQVGGNFGASRTTAEATVWELVGIGSIPLGSQFSLFGKIGLYRGEVDVSGTGIFGSASSTNTDLTFGVGARFDLTRNLALRGEWQRYQDIGGSDIGEADVDVLSLGVLWKF